MPVLDNRKHELFCEGLTAGLTQAQAYVNAGFSANSSDVGGNRLAKHHLVIKRLKELKLRKTSAAIEILTNPASVFVANAIRERQYRLTVLQELVDKLRLVIKERAEMYKDCGGGGSTGLLVLRKRNVGKVVVEELVIDAVVISELKDLLKQGAIETGEWQEGPQIQRVEDIDKKYPEYKNMSVAQLEAEHALLVETRDKLKAIRMQGQIEAPAGSVTEVVPDAQESQS